MIGRLSGTLVECKPGEVILIILVFIFVVLIEGY